MARSKSSPALPRSAKAWKPCIAQICADALGVNYSNIKVIHGQTDRIDKGMGAFASRVTVMCGEATRLAATKLRAELPRACRRTDAEQRQTCSISSTAQIVRRDFVRRAVLTLAELAREHAAPLSAEATFESSHMVYPYGVHIAAVRSRCRHRRRHHRALCDRLRHRQERSIRSWWKARSPAAWRRASAARCWRNFSMTQTASRSRSVSPIT